MTLDPREPTITIAVDWDNDGLFTGPNDDLRSRLLTGTLRVGRGRDTARVLAPPKVPDGAAEFANQDSLLSPENGNGPLFGLLEPGLGQPVSIKMALSGQVEVEYDAAIDYDTAVDYDGIVTYPMLAGVLNDLSDELDGFVHSAALSFLGNSSKLGGGERISTALYQGIRTGEAVGHVLDAAGWSPSLREIDVGDTVLDWFWCDDADPFDALNQIVATEGVPSIWYEGADGRIVFRARTYRSTNARSISPQVAIVDGAATNDGTALYHSGADLTPSWREARTKATMTVVRRVTGTLQKVWEYGGPLVLGANESRLITVPLSDPFVGAVAPASGTDYTIAAGTLASLPALENVKAQRLGIRFIAGAGGATIDGATSNGPQLRAQPVTVASQEDVANLLDTSAAIAKRGVRTLALDQQQGARAEINVATAQAICDAAVRYYQAPPSQVAVRIRNISELNLTHQLARDVGDMIAVTSTPRGLISALLWIEKIDHQRIPEGLETVWTCSRSTISGPLGIWDDPNSLWGSVKWGE